MDLFLFLGLQGYLLVLPIYQCSYVPILLILLLLPKCKLCPIYKCQ